MRSLVALCVTVTFYNSYTQKIPIYIYIFHIYCPLLFQLLFFCSFYTLYKGAVGCSTFSSSRRESWFAFAIMMPIHYIIQFGRKKIRLYCNSTSFLPFISIFFISLCLIFYVSFSEKEQTFTFDSFLLPSHHHYHQMHFFSQTLQKYSLLLPLQPLVLLV